MFELTIPTAVPYNHLRPHETVQVSVARLFLEKKNNYIISYPHILDATTET